MPSGKNIYKVLVAGANDKTFALLQTLLPGSNYEPPLRAGSAGEAKRVAMDCNVDIAILNAPMRDEFGTQLAVDLARDNVGVVLLVPGESYDQVCYRVEDDPAGNGPAGKAAADGPEKQGPPGKNDGYPHGEPGQMAADRAAAHDGKRGPPLYRAPGHGHAPVPQRGGGEHYQVV